MTGERVHQPLAWRNLCQNSLVESSCRSPGHCVYRSFPVFSPFPCRLGDSWSHKESLSRTVLRKNPLVEAQQDDISPMNLDQNAIFNTTNNDTAYANPDLRMEIQWKIFARQKSDIGLHSHPIVWRKLTTKASERLRQKNVSGKVKRNGAREKNYILGNKRMWAWIRWKSLRRTEKNRWEKAWN